LGKTTATQPTTVAEARRVLRNVETTAGVKAALVYITFVPSNVSSNAASGVVNTNPNPQNLRAETRNANDQLELTLVSAEGSPIRRRVDAAVRAQFFKTADEFRSQVTNVRSGRGYLPTAKTLYQWMIAPIEAELKAQGIQNLAFIMDSGLRSIPVAALHDGQKFLVEKYSLGLMPSLSLTNTQFKSVKDSQVLAMGSAKFAELKPLPAVPIELSTITPALWQGKSFLNDAFTLQNLKSQRQQQPFGIVHLATHAAFKPGAISNSYIELWDTKLRMNQLTQLGWNNPPVELLVLSACKTALGDEEAELGFAGLALQAGAKSAIASLWSVNDEGTLGLMTSLYQKLKIAPIKSQALQQAQIAMLQGQVNLTGGKLIASSESVSLPPELAKLGNRKLDHPYYWASFTIIGSPW
jgi:CHAT domain-containing protein